MVDGENEEILNRYEYDAWGKLTTCEEKVHNRFKFNGQQYDPISQQYYLRARYYNPVIGRFTQEDSYNVDGLNLYAYCRNNPVYYVDPSGNICETAAQKIMDKFSMDGNFNASRKEQKKLAAYLRNKDRNGTPLTPMETRMLNQINDYTYLPRYGQDVPNHIYTPDDNGDWHNSSNGRYVSDAEMGIEKPQQTHSGRGGRLGSEETRAQNRLIGDYLEDRGYEIFRGGGRAKEERLAGPGKGNAGCNFIDISARKGDITVRINTVDVYADGTMTNREAQAKKEIETKTGQELITIPKGAGLGDLSNIIDKIEGRKKN